MIKNNYSFSKRNSQHIVRVLKISNVIPNNSELSRLKRFSEVSPDSQKKNCLFQKHSKNGIIPVVSVPGDITSMIWQLKEYLYVYRTRVEIPSSLLLDHRFQNKKWHKTTLESRQGTVYRGT